MADHSDVEKKEAIFASWSTAKFATLIVGVIVLVLTVVTAVVAVSVYCYWRRRDRLNSKVNYYDNLTIKSAPLSRHLTPKQQRRTSCPDLQRSHDSSSSGSSDHQDFTIPAERVQPKAPFEQGFPNNSILQQQYSFIGSCPAELYPGAGCTSEDDLDDDRTNNATISFSVGYDVAAEKVTVNLFGVDGLPGRGRSCAARDPFVKLYLLPDEDTCSLSKSCQNTLSPVFNETFDFQVSNEELSKRTLRFSVYDVDKKRVRHSLGHVFVSLADVDLAANDIISRPLETLLTSAQTLGDIQLSLSYIPNDAKIKVIVNKARNIHADNPNGMYVKIEFYHWRRLCKTKRTAIKKGTFEPEYNESFSFNIRHRQLDSCSLLISATAVKYGAHRDDPVYGEVVLGPYTVCRGNQLQHWTEMLANPRQILTKWHNINPPTSHAVVD